VREFLASKHINVLEHPPYSPDLAPNDFFLIPKMKEILKGRHFDDIDDIRSNTTAGLKAILQNQFQNCFEGWTRRWHLYIASQGEYFEGDNNDVHFYHDEFANFIIRPRMKYIIFDFLYTRRNHAIGSLCPNFISSCVIDFFLVSLGGVRLSPLGTSAINWPIAPAPNDR
jgi:hypothetical protein